MITNITAHKTSTRLADTSPNTWLAIEKYANVSRPVEAIPTDRMLAPRPYEERCALLAPGRALGLWRGSAAVAGRWLEADKQHRPGERRAYPDEFAVAREQANERAL
jgi:hypothetical protein